MRSYIFKLFTSSASTSFGMKLIKKGHSCIVRSPNIIGDICWSPPPTAQKNSCKNIAWKHRMESIFLQGAVFLLLQVISQVNWWILLFAPAIRYPHFDTSCGLQAANNHNSQFCCHELPYLTYKSVLNKLVYLNLYCMKI